MTYQNSSAENELLCRKLTLKYRARFNAAIQNAAAIEKRRKENIRLAAEKKANAKKASVKAAKAAKASKKFLPGLISAKNSAHEPTFKNGAFVPNNGKFTYAYARGANLRAYAADFDRELYERFMPADARCRDGAYDGAEEARTRKKTSRRAARKEKKRISKAAEGYKCARREETDAPEERRVRTAPISKAFVAALALCTALITVMIYTYSSYSQISATVSDLRSEEEVLTVERDRLKGRIELRDDIRVIEDRAVNEIGMVQSDYVEKRYVSIAGGERIDVISNDSGEESASFFSTLLSAMGGQFERFLEDYID